MSKIKILITVEGGIVQAVSTNCDADIVIIDFDNQSDEPVCISEVSLPDSIIEKDEKFHEKLYKGEQTGNDNYAKNRLKELDF